MINYFSASLRTVIGNTQHIITLLIFPVFLINITDVDQHCNIADPLPFNLICYLRRLPVGPVFHQLKHLFGF